MKRPSPVRYLALSLALAVTATSPSAFAGNRWDGGAGTGKWSDIANWNADGLPASNATLEFAGTTQTTNNNDLVGTSFSRIEFKSDAGAFVITGNALTLTGPLVNGSTQLQTINLDIALGANVTLTSSSANMALGGKLSGSSVFIINAGSQEVAITGDNSLLTGELRVQRGTVLLGHNNAAGTNTIQVGEASGSTAVALLTSGAVTISNNATLVSNHAATATIGGNTAHASTFSGNFTLNGGHHLTVTAATGGTVSFTGNLLKGSGTAAANVTKEGTGTVVFAGANTFTGTTTINAGTLQIGNGGTTGTLLTTSAITNNGSLAFNRSDAVVQGTDFSSAAITGTGGLVKLGVGSLTLNVANTYSGATTVNAGSLILTSGGSIASTAYTIATGATFNASAKSNYSLTAVATTIGIGATTAGYFNGPYGTLTLGNSLTLNFSTSLIADGQTYDLFNFGNQTGTFSSVSLTGSIAGSLDYTDIDTWAGSADGYNFTFDEASGVLSVVSAVPEPSAYAALFGTVILGAVVLKRHQHLIHRRS